jgi:hypothetical protein
VEDGVVVQEVYPDPAIPQRMLTQWNGQEYPIRHDMGVYPTGDLLNPMIIRPDVAVDFSMAIARWGGYSPESMLAAGKTADAEILKIQARLGK